MTNPGLITKKCLNENCKEKSLLNNSLKPIQSMKVHKSIYFSFGLEYRDILTILSKFDLIKAVIKDDRNVVKVSNLNGIPVVIKYYKKIPWVNRLIYSFIRKTKAQRAYENAEILTHNGITTPLQVAFVDIYKFNILHKSYFISLYVNCKSTDQLFKQPLEKCKDALKSFARFTYKLHKLGIFHNDYSPGNVLYSVTADGFDFCLIDNNRIKFRSYSRQRAIRNLRRINLPLDKYAVFAMEYSQMEQSDAMDTVQRMLFYFQTRKVLKKFRNQIKQQIKKMFGVLQFFDKPAID